MSGITSRTKIGLLHGGSVEPLTSSTEKGDNLQEYDLCQGRERISRTPPTPIDLLQCHRCHDKIKDKMYHLQQRSIMKNSMGS